MILAKMKRKKSLGVAQMYRLMSREDVEAFIYIFPSRALVAQDKPIHGGIFLFGRQDAAISCAGELRANWVCAVTTKNL